jgi:hypothetical protein
LRTDEAGPSSSGFGFCQGKASMGYLEGNFGIGFLLDIFPGYYSA